MALEPQEDGSYLLPEEWTLLLFRYTMQDKVYNTTEMDIEGKKVEQRLRRMKPGSK